MPSEESAHYDRRKFLKIIAASTAALGASAFWPKEWKKPMVGFGTLPVHAQSSILPGSISGMVWVEGTPLDDGTMDLYSGHITMKGVMKVAKPAARQENLPGPGFLATTQTVNGAYAFTNLAPGLYHVYCAWMDSFENCSVTAGLNTVVNFGLLPD
jgi:hypothetical protein